MNLKYFFIWIKIEGLLTKKLIFTIKEKAAYEVLVVWTTRWLYLGHFTSYQENKGTLFSSTLKVEENKVSLFSW